MQDVADLPSDWVALPSSAHPGSVFYYNVRTRTSRFEAPLTTRAEPTQVRARHVLIKHRSVRNTTAKGAHPGEVTRTEAEALALVSELHAQVMADPARFEEVARTHSDCNSYARGGDLGAASKRGTWHEDFSNVVFALDVGEISGVVSSPSGYHIIQRLE